MSTLPKADGLHLDDLHLDELAHLAALGFDAPTFSKLRAQLRSQTLPSNLIEGTLDFPDEEVFRPAPEANSPAGQKATALGSSLLAGGRAALILLNGGMATRFGGRVKGVVDALPGNSFLALQAKRLAQLGEGAAPPLLLMNSEATDAATKDHLEAASYFGLDPDNIFTFRQSAAPRLYPDGSLFRDPSGALSLYGPGHGDLLPSLKASGALAWLLERGIDYLLMANVDNLGASLDPLLLGRFAGGSKELMAEVVERQAGERGGSPCLVNGRVQIVEDFAFPPGFEKAAIPCFNTNTLWFRTEALEADHPLRWYAVEKQALGQSVVQFERLVGQLSWFLDTEWALVSRERFLPIKTPEDLRHRQSKLQTLFASLGL